MNFVWSSIYIINRAVILVILYDVFGFRLDLREFLAKGMKKKSEEAALEDTSSSSSSDDSDSDSSDSDDSDSDSDDSGTLHFSLFLTIILTIALEC